MLRNLLYINELHVLFARVSHNPDTRAVAGALNITPTPGASDRHGPPGTLHIHKATP